MAWIKVPREVSVDMIIATEIIKHIGTIEFDQVLLKLVNHVAPISEVSGYLFSSANEPLVAGWCGNRADTASRVRRYVDEYYKLDPVLKNMPASAAEHDNFYRPLFSRMIEQQEYRWPFFDEPGFHSEVTVVHRSSLVWNMVKFRLKIDQLTADQLAKIGELGAFLYPVVLKHTLSGDGSYNYETRPMAEERLLQRLNDRFPELTLRERQVCALTIVGNTTQQVADELDITPSTVMTYRRRAYDRLGVNNANTLVRELI